MASMSKMRYFLDEELWCEEIETYTVDEVNQVLGPINHHIHNPRGTKPDDYWDWVIPFLFVLIFVYLGYCEAPSEVASVVVYNETTTQGPFGIYAPTCPNQSGCHLHMGEVKQQFEHNWVLQMLASFSVERDTPYHLGLKSKWISCKVS